MDEIPWFVIKKTVFVIEKGLLLMADKETDPSFVAGEGDAVEIVRPNGSRLRTRIQECYPNASRSGDDLIVDVRQSDVPPGSRLRVLRAASQGRGGHGGRGRREEREDRDE